MRSAVALALALLLPACADTELRLPASAEGAAIAQNPGSSRSRYNVFACTTCHAVRPSEVGARLLPGAPLEGAARRASFWGGETVHLHEAVERCWTFYMRGTPTDLDGRTGEALYAWLESLSPDGSTAGAQPVGQAPPFAPVLREGRQHLVGRDDTFAQERGADGKAAARTPLRCRWHFHCDPFGGTDACSPYPAPACARGVNGW